MKPSRQPFTTPASHTSVHASGLTGSGEHLAGVGPRVVVEHRARLAVGDPAVVQLGPPLDAVEAAAAYCRPPISRGPR